MRETKTKKYAVAIVHGGWKYWVNEDNISGTCDDCVIDDLDAAKRAYKLQMHILDYSAIIELREYSNSGDFRDYIVLEDNKNE